MTLTNFYFHSMMPTKTPFRLPSEQLRNAYYALTKSAYYDLQPLTKTAARLLKTGTDTFIKSPNEVMLTTTAYEYLWALPII